MWVRGRQEAMWGFIGPPRLINTRRQRSWIAITSAPGLLCAGKNNACASILNSVEMRVPVTGKLLAFAAAIIMLSAFTIDFSDSIKLVAEPNHSTIGFSMPISGGLTRITGKF